MTTQMTQESGEAEVEPKDIITTADSGVGGIRRKPVPTVRPPHSITNTPSF